MVKFNDLSPEEQDKYLDEIIYSATTTPQTTPKKGKPKMAKMTKQTIALLKWREEHTDKNGKLQVNRREPVAILAELKKKKDFYLGRVAMIEKKIRYYDNRINAGKRKELLSKISTEDLEKLVASLNK